MTGFFFFSMIRRHPTSTLFPYPTLFRSSLAVTLRQATALATVTASDAGAGGYTSNTSASLTVNAGAATKLQILLPGEVAAPGTGTGKTGAAPTAQAAGVAFNVTVNSVDANWNVVSTTELVHLASNVSIPTLAPAARPAPVPNTTRSPPRQATALATVTASDAGAGGYTSNT